MDTPLRLKYQTVEFDLIDIHVCTLRDRQQYSDPDGVAEALGISSATWPVFGVVWPSSLVLAHFLLDYDTRGKRILEAGCGIALTSLLLNKQHQDITATDYHPAVEFFLQRNTRLNDSRLIPFQRVDWAKDNEGLGRFDMIIGSDLLYEDRHIEQLGDFIEHHANPACEVIITDPGRGRKTRLAKKLWQYGFGSSHCKPVHTDYLDVVFKGGILVFSRNGK